MPLRSLNSTRGRITPKQPFISRKREMAGKKWGRSGEKLGKSERRILEAVSSNPEITIAELSERIGIGTTAIENNIKKLKKKGFLERVGSRKEGQWKLNK